jgi:hypothetical protein
MGRFAHSDLARRLREAHAACEESAATGIPIDEVADMRASAAPLVRWSRRITMPPEECSSAERQPTSSPKR